MKAITLSALILALCVSGVFSQEQMVVGWTFPGNTLVADTGASINSTQEIWTMGNTAEPELKNGYTTKAAQVTGWDGGAGEKAWVIAFNAQGYWNLTISSRQQSGGNDPGPKFYTLQYSLDGGTSWVNLEGGNLTIENDWETSFVDQLSLPEECDDTENLMIRWLMASNEASGSGGEVAANGKNKIDEIFIRGELVDGAEEMVQQLFRISPGYGSGALRIEADEIMKSVSIFSLQGQVVQHTGINRASVVVNFPSDLKKGIVIVSVLMKHNNRRYTHKYYYPGI